MLYFELVNITRHYIRKQSFMGPPGARRREEEQFSIKKICVLHKSSTCGTITPIKLPMPHNKHVPVLHNIIFSFKTDKSFLFCLNPSANV